MFPGDAMIFSTILQTLQVAECHSTRWRMLMWSIKGRYPLRYKAHCAYVTTRTLLYRNCGAWFGGHRMALCCLQLLFPCSFKRIATSETCPTLYISVLHSPSRFWTCRFFLSWIAMVTSKWPLGHECKCLYWYFNPLLIIGSHLETKQTWLIPRQTDIFPHSQQTAPQQTLWKTHSDPHLTISKWGSIMLGI